MPVAGPKPKTDRSQVVHKNPTYEFTEVPNVPFAGAPPLRKRQTGGVSVMAVGVENSEEWPDATLMWWKAISTMPHAALWTDTDWIFAMDSAEIHARTMEGWRGYGGPSLTAREKQLGMTADFRRDLRIKYVDPKTRQQVPGNDVPAGVTKLDDYRNL